MVLLGIDLFDIFLKYSGPDNSKTGTPKIDKLYIFEIGKIGSFHIRAVPYKEVNTYFQCSVIFFWRWLVKNWNFCLTFFNNYSNNCYRGCRYMKKYLTYAIRETMHAQLEKNMKCVWTFEERKLNCFDCIDSVFMHN